MDYLQDPENDGIARVEHFRRIVDGQVEASDSYLGIPIFASHGLHDYAAEEMRRLGLVQPGKSALDIACGAGAMSQRLGDSGMRVLGLDALPGIFRAKGPTICHAGTDANARFEATVTEAVDLVVAMEIVEHVENPRAFLRSCFACLRPGGVLFLTTPNTDSSYSVVSLLLNGHFARFDDAYLRNDGHISPICRHQLLAAGADAGFELISEAGFGRDQVAARSWPKFWVLLQLARLLRRVPESREAMISTYALRRPA